MGGATTRCVMLHHVDFKRPLVEAEDTSSSNIDRELPEPKRQKRSRTIFTCLQLHNLEGMFEVNEYPDKLMRESIAAELDVTENKINVSKLTVIFLIYPL